MRKRVQNFCGALFRAFLYIAYFLIVPCTVKFGIFRYIYNFFSFFFSPLFFHVILSWGKFFGPMFCKAGRRGIWLDDLRRLFFSFVSLFRHLFRRLGSLIFLLLVFSTFALFLPWEMYLWFYSEWSSIEKKQSPFEIEPMSVSPTWVSGWTKPENFPPSSTSKNMNWGQCKWLLNARGKREGKEMSLFYDYVTLENADLWLFLFSSSIRLFPTKSKYKFFLQIKFYSSFFSRRKTKFCIWRAFEKLFLFLNHA